MCTAAGLFMKDKNIEVLIFPSICVRVRKQMEIYNVTERNKYIFLFGFGNFNIWTLFIQYCFDTKLRQTKSQPWIKNQGIITFKAYLKTDLFIRLFTSFNNNNNNNKQISQQPEIESQQYNQFQGVKRMHHRSKFHFFFIHSQ